MVDFIKKIREKDQGYLISYSIDHMDKALRSLRESLGTDIDLKDLHFVTGMGGTLLLMNSGIEEEKITLLLSFDNVKLSVPLKGNSLPISSYEVHVYYGSTVVCKLYLV